MNAVIYARVSSTGDRQSTERQALDLSDYADKNGLTVQQVYEEHISGAKRDAERPVLTECLITATSSLATNKNKDINDFPRHNGPLRIYNVIVCAEDRFRMSWDNEREIVSIGIC